MALKIVSESTGLVVSLVDIKAHLNISTTGDDARLISLIKVATEYCERETGRDFHSKTWDILGNSFPSGAIAIDVPRPPLQSVTHVKYLVTSSTTSLTTIAASTYVVFNPTNLPGQIKPLASWPAAYSNRPDSVQIRFVSGTTDVPDTLSHAIKMLVGSWNEIREGEIVGTITSEVKIGVARLLQQLDVGDYS